MKRVGILYRDDEIELSRSANGVVSMVCPLPVQVWQSSKKGHAAVCVVGFKQHRDGSLTEIRRPSARLVKVRE